MFSKIAIADRGEVVMRVARTCERMGVATLGFHVGASADAAYAAACDERVAIELDASSRFDSAALLRAAQAAGAQAVHPGGGALAADAAFARATVEAGLCFVGAAPETLERLSRCDCASELARLAGVRALPRSPTVLTRAQDAVEQARELGYPLQLAPPLAGAELVVIDGEDELLASFEDALSRARAAGAGGVQLERWLERPRLLSVVLIANDKDTLALGDVERSLQLDGRTILDEAPAPALRSPRGAQRQLALRDAAIRIASEAGLRGTGAADFVLDLDGRLYLSGLRPALAAEHATIEMCTGLDLVELQLKVAAGEPLGHETWRARGGGHAVQARIEAEGTFQDAVEITGLRWPTVAPGSLRIDTELAPGSRAPVDVDPLLAKVTAYGPTRHQAVLTLDRVLAEATLEPVPTNLAFVREILSDESFRAGQYDTAFAAQLRSELTSRT